MIFMQQSLYFYIPHAFFYSYRDIHKAYLPHSTSSHSFHSKIVCYINVHIDFKYNVRGQPAGGPPIQPVNWGCLVAEPSHQLAYHGGHLAGGPPLLSMQLGMPCWQSPL